MMLPAWKGRTDSQDSSDQQQQLIMTEIKLNIRSSKAFKALELAEPKTASWYESSCHALGNVEVHPL